MDDYPRTEIPRPEDVLAEGKKAEKLNQRITDFKHSFSGLHGVRTYKYLSDFCLEHRSTFVEDSARRSDFNEGARAVILEIRRWLDYDLTKLNQE